MQANTYTIYSNSNFKPNVSHDEIKKLISELESFQSAKAVETYITNKIGFYGINSIYLSNNCKLEVKNSLDFYKVVVSFTDEKLVFSYKKSN